MNSTLWLPVDETLTPIEGWETLSEAIGGVHSWLIEYYKRCRRGEIRVGRELATTLERCVQDILFHWDTYPMQLSPAHVRITFIERELKHFESPFAGKPFLLSLNQKAIAEALFGFRVFDGTLLGGGRWVRRYK